MPYRLLTIFASFSPSSFFCSSPGVHSPSLLALLLPLFLQHPTWACLLSISAPVTLLPSGVYGSFCLDHFSVTTCFPDFQMSFFNEIFSGHPIQHFTHITHFYYLSRFIYFCFLAFIIYHGFYFSSLSCWSPAMGLQAPLLPLFTAESTVSHSKCSKNTCWMNQCHCHHRRRQQPFSITARQQKAGKTALSI